MEGGGIFDGYRRDKLAISHTISSTSKGFTFTSIRN
jgi:hypothetical protein